MIKILLAILLLVAGVKLFADSRAFVYKYEIAKLADQCEEEKEEVKEGKSKHDIEDNTYYNNVLHFFASFTLTKVPMQSSKQNIYTSFVDGPKAPPPDIA